MRSQNFDKVQYYILVIRIKFISLEIIIKIELLKLLQLK